MEEPKTQIYNKLSEIEEITVYQIRPEILTVGEFPIVTFFISQNIPQYVLDGDIAIQDVQVTIDIWGLTSTQTGGVMTEVEAAMRELKYRLTNNLDVPDPEGYSHLNLIFNY